MKNKNIRGIWALHGRSGRTTDKVSLVKKPISIQNPNESTAPSIRQLLETMSGHHVVKAEEFVKVLTVLRKLMSFQSLAELVAEF